MTLDEAIAEVKAGNVRNWGGFDTNPEAVATIITAVASGDLIPRPHEYTLSAEAQRIVDTVKDAPQWDTTRDRLASPHGDMIPLADHRLADTDALEEVQALRAKRDDWYEDCMIAEAEVAQVKSDLEAWMLAANNRAIWLQNTRAEVARLREALTRIEGKDSWIDASIRSDGPERKVMRGEFGEIARAALQLKT